MDNEGFDERWCWEKKKKRSQINFDKKKIPMTNLLKIQGWGHIDISHICSYAAKKKTNKETKAANGPRFDIQQPISVAKSQNIPC